MNARLATSAAAWTVVAGLMIAASLAWLIRPGVPMTSEQSQLALLRAAPRAWLTTGYVAGEGLRTRSDILKRLRISAPAGGDALLRVPWVPAGRYQIQTRSNDGKKRSYQLAIGREAWPVSTWEDGDIGPPFTLPIPVHSVRVSSSTAGDAGPSAWLEVLDVYQGTDAPVAQRVTRYGAVDVYSLDADGMTETGGFWLSSDRDSRYVLASDHGQPLGVRMTFEAEITARVRLARGEWRAETRVEPGRKATVLLPPAPADEVLTLHVDGPRQARAVWVSVAPAP